MIKDDNFITCRVLLTYSMTASQHSGEVVTGWGEPFTRFGLIRTAFSPASLSPAAIASRAAGTDRG